ncbi:DNA circularization protein [Herminiimonas sp. CN]|uniref:DNA circularization protein n=1 Tax=Herminiimonas sp. CN TaxID=1349818 RepID=UPI00047414FE|nr:DNA circularization N-terminal domain-containing protein [Herminiimonas sp. CN]
MSFRDELQPASFRGVRFEVSSADTSVGRRTVLHEFPLKDLPLPEDMGRKASEFVIDGFLIGDNYLFNMKRLIAALTEAGPGTLIHPSLGTLQVSLAHPARLREQFIERRGMVSFSLAFVEAGEEVQPSTEVDTQQAVDDAADDAYGPMEEDFASEFSVDGAPAWSVQSIVDEIGHINDVVSSVRSAMRFDLSALSQLVRAGSMLKANVMGLLAMPNALFTELSVQFRALVGLFDFSGAQGSSVSPSRSLSALGAVLSSSSSFAGTSSVAGASSGATSSVNSFGNASKPTNPLRSLLPLAMYGYAPAAGSNPIYLALSLLVNGQISSSYVRPTIPTNTPVRRQQAANQAAVFALVARCAVVEAVRSSIYLPFASADESVAVRDILYDALDMLMLDAPDAVYAALHDLRSAMVRDITARGADLAQLSKMTLPASVPAQVLSYRLYGSGAYAAELVERNQAAATVLHPLFVPGGLPLEVRRVV